MKAIYPECKLLHDDKQVQGLESTRGHTEYHERFLAGAKQIEPEPSRQIPCL